MRSIAPRAVDGRLDRPDDLATATLDSAVTVARSVGVHGRGHLGVDQVPELRAGHRAGFASVPLLRTPIPGIRTSCHYGQEIASSSIRVTGGSWLGAMNAA